MKKIVIVLIIILSGYDISYSQASKVVYAELGGPGIIASANFDTRFSSKNDGWGGRIGIGGISIFGIGVVTVPIGLNYLMGKDGKNYFELGAGYTLVSGRISGRAYYFETSLANLSIGYRFMPERAGIMFKAEITPLFTKEIFNPIFGGVGIGYKF